MNNNRRTFLKYLGLSPTPLIIKEPEEDPKDKELNFKNLEIARLKKELEVKKVFENLGQFSTPCSFYVPPHTFKDL